MCVEPFRHHCGGHKCTHPSIVSLPIRHLLACLSSPHLPCPSLSIHVTHSLKVKMIIAKVYKKRKDKQLTLEMHQTCLKLLLDGKWSP